MGKPKPVDLVSSLVGKPAGKPISLVVASLGNPGAKYEFTRHNAGHLVLDSVRQKLQIGKKIVKPIQGGALTRFEQYPGLSFMESNHYMNLSGRAIRGFNKWYDKHLANPENHSRKMIVLHDELDLPFGEVAYKQPSRASNGHRGLKHITLQTADEFARIRIGIGRPDSKRRNEVADYVLGRLTQDELEVLQEQTSNQVVDMLQTIIDSSVLTNYSKDTIRGTY